VTLGLILSLTIWLIQPYLMALMTGAFMALLAQPAYRLLRRYMSPKFAAGVATLGLILLVVLPLGLFTLLVVRQAIMISGSISQLHLSSMDQVLDRLSQWWPLSLVVESPEDLKQMITQLLNQWGGAATKLMVELAKGIPDNLMQMALAALACFFIVMDGGRLVSWIGSLIPLAPKIREKLAASFKNTAISVVWASMAAAGAQALLMGIAYLVTGVPAAALAAAATFIFAWIPLLGSVPVWISGLIYLYAQGNITALVILIVFGAITGVLDNVVRPWVLRGRGEMHPLVSLVAIFGGLKMFGIMGVFFGPIMVASLLTLLQVWPTVAKEEGIAL